MRHHRGLILLLIAALPVLLGAPALLAQTPDRTPLADEWGYRPADGATVPLNPPSLTWVHEKEAAGYDCPVGRQRRLSPAPPPPATSTGASIPTRSR